MQEPQEKKQLEHKPWFTVTANGYGYLEIAVCDNEEEASEAYSTLLKQLKNDAAVMERLGHSAILSIQLTDSRLPNATASWRKNIGVPPLPEKVS